MSDRLEHVYWIGGGSGAGKSTIAHRLANKHGLYHYSTDDVMADHGVRCSKSSAPFLEAFKKMDMNERWVNRSPEVMLETFHWFNGEGFGLIIEDIENLPKKKGVIVEGFRLLPHLLKPILTRPRQAVWLLPSDDFRAAAFANRGTLWEIANKTTDPKRALQNLLRRDSLFTDHLEEELKETEMPMIKVDQTTTEDELSRRISLQFGL